jgi:hypothetical protein
VARRPKTAFVPSTTYQSWWMVSAFAEKVFMDISKGGASVLPPESLGKPSRITAFRRLGNTRRRLIRKRGPSPEGPGQNPPRGWRRQPIAYPSNCRNATGWPFGLAAIDNTAACGCAARRTPVCALELPPKKATLVILPALLFEKRTRA